MMSFWLSFQWLFWCFLLQLRIYAQPSQLKTAEYAANVTKVIFDHFEEYFNMSYSISKLGTLQNQLETVQFNLTKPIQYQIKIKN